jgi:hypothetical protein
VPNARPSPTQRIPRPDELLENAPRLWPEMTTPPFRSRHPVTGKEFGQDKRGSFPDA